MSETIHSPEPDLRQDSKAAENELAAKDKDLAFARADAVQRARAFEAAFSSVAEGMVVYDALGQPVMANPAAVADFGFDPSKSDRAGALQKLAVRYPDGKKVPLDKMPSSRALNGEKVVNERYIFTNGKGMDQTILVSAYPLVSRGRISGAVSTSRHVTELENLRQNIQSLSEELKGANEDLRREKNTLRTLIEHAPDDIWFCDAQGNVSLANLSALESLGLGKHIPNGPLSDFASELEIYSPGGDPIALDQLPLFRSLRGKTVKGFEEIIVHPKTGKKLYRAVNSAPVRDSAGNMLGAVCIVRDITEQKQAEEALRQNEEKYRMILENMEEGYYEVDLAGNFIFVNPAFAGMGGYSEDELIGTNYAEFSDPEKGKKIYQAFNKVYVSGEPFKGFDWEVIRKDGTVFTTEISISLMRVEKGRPIGFRGVARDVTARRKMEARFRTERARLETILESAPVAIVVADEKGRIILANEIAAELYGRPVPYGEGFDSHHKLCLCYPDGRPYNPNDLPLTRSVLHGESFSEVEIAVIWPDGTRKDLLANSTPIKDAKGDVIGAVGAFQDVTSFMAQREDLRNIKRELQKRVHERTAELSHSKEILETIINHIPVMLCFYEANGQVKLINREFEDRIGWSLDEARAMDIMEACYPDKEYRQEVWGYMMEAKPGWRDFKVTSRDGSILNSSWANNRLSDGTRIGIGVDITERLEYEESLRRRNEELELEIARREKFEKALKASREKILRQHEQRKYVARRLVDLLEKDRRDVAMFLHDEIGQTLTTLKMDLEIAENRFEDSTLVREKLGAAKQKALEALGFTKQVAAQLRPSTLDTLGFLPSIRSLISAIEEVADFEIHFFAKGLPDRLEKKKELALYRIVQESLTNALKHSGAGEIFINLTCRDGAVQLTVEDDGRGFDCEQVASGTHGKGSPLGISIMRERAAQFGGTFRIESQPGKGTQVMVEIPI